MSDSHGDKKTVEKILLQQPDMDYILFAGDGIQEIKQISEEMNKEIFFVSGNCDYFSREPTERLLSIFNKKIFLTHGHKYNVKFGLNRLFYRAKEISADIVIFGHTHKSENFKKENILFFNPGSVIFSEDYGTGTYGIIEILDNGETQGKISSL